MVQVINTKTMKVLLQGFFGILRAFGKKIVIITDMCRFEEGVWVWEAGVDLLSMVYNDCGMSNKVIIFNKDI